MTEKSNLTPKRRFTKFQNDQAWTLRNLGEIANFSKGNGYSKNDLTSMGKPIILYGRLYKKYETIIDYVDTFTLEKENSVISTGNEVIIPASGESSEDISRASVVSKPGIILGGDLNIVRPNNEIDPVFLALSISNGKQQKELSKRAQGKSVVHLHNSDLKEVNLFSPEKVEQIEIGNFFEKLDNIIILQQQKLEKSKALKAAYLSEMFPTEGETSPKRRFSGFTHDWKSRKLGELTESFEYGLNASATLFDGINKYIRITDIDDKTRIFNQSALTSPDSNLSNAKNYLLKEGDILFARTGASVGKTYQYKESDGKVFYAGFLIRARINPNFDSEFVFQSTLTKQYNNFVKITSQRSGQPGINAQEYSQFELMVPTFEEQKKISTFFKSLDNIISFNKCKLEKLQNLKKAYLTEMFI